MSKKDLILFIGTQAQVRCPTKTNFWDEGPLSHCKGDVMEQMYQAGDVVYVFYRNPHTQDVANIQAAAVVNHPERPNELALFLYETYYPLSNEVAVYSTEEEANQAYQYYYGDVSEGTFE